MHIGQSSISRSSAGWYWKAVRVGVMGMYSPLRDHGSRLFSFPLCRPAFLYLCSSLCHSPLRPSLIYSSVSPISCASHSWLHRKSFVVLLGLQKRISRSTCIFPFLSLSYLCLDFGIWAGACVVLCYASILPWFRQKKLTLGVSSLMLLCVPVILFVLHLFAFVVNYWFILKDCCLVYTPLLWLPW